jgi:methyltransferase (TIGR00027 family)
MESIARSSILVAAARAFGSREPDESLRNPDFLADKLIGPEELALIADHPLSTGLTQPYEEASLDPAIVGITWLMLMRTRFIDEALTRAVTNGATQIVILGAGFDSRAYRFQHLLQHCKVIEVDAPHTQQYKKQRVAAVLHVVPPNLTYLSVDFAKDDLCLALQSAGLTQTQKTFYIWEGVSMYLPEASVRNTLQCVTAISSPGSSLVLDYVNSLGLEYTKSNPRGRGAVPASWGEPWLFGVPDSNGSSFFQQLGFNPGVPFATTSPEAIRRYTTGQDGSVYGTKVFAKLRAESQASTLSPEALEARQAIAAAGGVYWLTELTVL